MPAATCVFEDGEGVKAFFVRGLYERKKFFRHHLADLIDLIDSIFFFLSREAYAAFCLHFLHPPRKRRKFLAYLVKAFL